MKTLLRNAQTGLYVRSADGWTGQPAEALDFRTMRRAIRFADQAGFRKMELTFVSDDSQCPLPIALDDLRARLSVSNRGD